MGTLFDLLKATAAGQSDTLARWRRAVSLALDSGAAAAAPQYAYGKGIAAQAFVGVNTDLEFEGVGLVNGIPRSAGDPDAWLLTPGNLYLLRGVGYFDTFSDPATGAIEIQWVDDAANPLQGGTVDCPTARFVPVSGTAAASPAAAVEILYLCPTPFDPVTSVVKLRCTGATGTATKPASTWSAMLLQIPNGA